MWILWKSGLRILWKNYKKITNLIKEESKEHKLQKEKNKLLKSFTTFNTDKSNIIIINQKDENKNQEDYDYLDKLIIKEYTKDSLYKDLNKWLLNYNKKFYEFVAYFTGRLIYSLNLYAKNNLKYFNEKEVTLYRGIKIPYSCLLPYERAIGKIIILTAFTSTSESKSKVIKFSGRNNSVELYKTNQLFSVIFYIKNYGKRTGFLME